MNKFRTVLLLTGTTGLFAAGLSTPALAAPSAVSTVCTVEVTRLQAYDLKEENNDGDEIKLKINDTWHGPWDFTAGQVRTGSLGRPTENYSTTATLTLYEIDLVTRTRIAGISVPCSPGSFTEEFEGNGAGYQVSFTVS